MNGRKRRVLLINPPSPEGTTANREGAAGLGVLYPSPGAFFYPAHTLASIAAVLRRLGYGVMVMDMAAWQGAPLLAAKLIKTGRWDSVIVFVSHATLEYDLDFTRFLRRVGGCPPITLVGPATRSLPPDLIGVPAEAVVLGEPEKAMLEFHERMLERGDRSIPTLIRSSGCGFVEDLDSLPFPAWDLVPPGKGGFLTIFGSKGCDRRCAYCPYVVAQGGRLRTRSVDSVLEEIHWLTESFSTRRVMFRDIVFARDASRVEAFCSALLGNKRTSLQWECESHPFDFRAESLALMKRAGCVEIKMGLESAHPGLLRRWGRVESAHEAGVYLDHVADILETSRRVGIRCHLFLMVGAPGQTQESIQATLSYLRPIRPTLLNVKLFQAYPGISLTGGAGDPRDAAVFSQLLRSCQAPASSVQARSFFPGFMRPLHKQPVAR